MIVNESWRVENAKSPLAILQENNPDATRVSIYHVCPWYFVVPGICDVGSAYLIPVSKLVTTALLSLA